MTWIDFIAEPWRHEFMIRAILVTVVASVVAAVLSCWLVLIGWSLMGDAVSHAVLPGVVLAYVLGLPFALGALVFGVAAVALIGTVSRISQVKEDAAIGVVFTTLFALGLVLISVIPSQTDLNHILFGNVLGVLNIDLLQVLVLGAIALTITLLKRRDLTLYAFDRAHAHVIGLNTRWLDTLLLGLLALTVVVGLQAVGVVLVVAMLIIPGATSLLLTSQISKMLVIAPILGGLCSLAGLYVSFYADTSPGGTVVLSQGVVFTLVYLLAPEKGIVAGFAKRRRSARLVAA